MKSTRIFPFLAGIGSFALLGAASVIVRAGENPADEAAKLKFFEAKVRPLLADRCYSCHSGERPKANLSLDTWEGVKKGAASGPAVIPGDPENSPLITAVHYDGGTKMPPTGKLDASEIETLTEWVKMGAPWTTAKTVETAKNASYIISPAQKSFWSFKPIVRPAVPKVKNSAWVKTPIDAFILEKLEAKGLFPALAADRRTLIRRATYDLIGLPPTPAEIAAFVADKSPNAFAKVVDRLLASPHYGERWGRHWLDVVRYADSNGLDENLAFANAFRYRDYVINAFNKDKPYDQFVCEQLAGDLMKADDPDVRAERLTATGFLVMGAKVLAEQDKPKLVMDIADEQIEVTSKAFLGLTVACARCHNHKFDPIPTTDYYALAGIFKSTRAMKNLDFVSNWMERDVPTKADTAKAEQMKAELAAAQKMLEAEKTRANEALALSVHKDAAKYLLASAEIARQPGARTLAETPANPGEFRLIIEAETFVRGNALRDSDNYGRGIGVIHTGASPTDAEWDITPPSAGTYQLELRYAAEEPRPVKISLNGSEIRKDAAGSVTGGWFPEHQKWEAQAVVTLKAGKNVLRIERDGAIPHIDKIALIPVNAGSGVMKTAEQIAKDYGVKPEIAEVWTKVLEASAKEPLFGAWVAFAHLSKDDFAHRAFALTQRIASGKDLPFAPAPLISRRFANFHPASLAEVAERYAALFQDTDAEWLSVRKANPAADKLPDAELEAVRAALYDPKGLAQPPKDAVKLYTEADRKTVETAEAAVKTADEGMKTAIPVAMAVEEGKIQDVRVHIRGNTLTLGEVAPRVFLSVIAGQHQTPIDDKRSGRLELAQWLISANNPLPARVAVNRIWQEHFGAGLSRTPENFGLLGERPANPQLLDWLAATFRQQGWSMKKMHRLIMLSSAYQEQVVSNQKAALIDPENRLLWRANRRRLEAEPFRDAILAVAGTLDPAMGGTLMKVKDYDYVTDDQSNVKTVYDAPRRSVYLPIVRNALFDMFQAYDVGDPSAVNAKRSTTTVAPQALWAMNSPFVLEQARHWAADLLKAEPTDAARVQTMYRRAFGRAATAPEVLRASGFIAKITPKLAVSEPDAEKRKMRAWQMLAQAIFASNEFIYVD